MPKSEAYNMDCMEYMKTIPDKFFDLCICDSPYGSGVSDDTEHVNERGYGSQSVNVERERERDGTTDLAAGSTDTKRWNRFGQRFDRYKHPDMGQIRGWDNLQALSTVPPPPELSEHGKSVERTGGTWAEKYGKKIIEWDVAPGKEFFDEIFRVSLNQIIFGANYFPNMPPTRCFLVWRKLSISESFSMAMAEYAWTSFNTNAKVFECAPQGKANDPRFHPCLPAGTKVKFDGTWKNVEEIGVGARNEFGVVSAVSSHTAQKMVEIQAGRKSVTATWNHPFLVKRGRSVYWVNADQLIQGDELLCLRKHTLSPKKDTSDTELTERGSEWNTAWFGKNTMEKFLTECKSIISTVIRPITILRTSSLSLHLNTSGCTKVANLWTVFGISLARAVESTKPSRKKTGISDATQDGCKARYANRAMSKKLSKIVVCGYQKVGNVKIINEETKVYNLTLDGVPAFETEIGITHNTQKPVALYRWIFQHFAHDGDIILDTHLGSGSSRIAAYDAGLRFIGSEIDPVYFQKEEDRFARHTENYSLFD